MTAAPMPPLAVFQEGSTWRWTCRLPHCHRGEWRGRHRDALADGLRHAADHREFGFRGKR